MIESLQQWSVWPAAYFSFEWLIRLAMLLWIPTRRSPDAAKGWLLLIFFLPGVGLVLYWLIGRADMPRWRRQRLAQIHQALAPTFHRLAEHPAAQPAALPQAWSPAATLTRNLSRLPALAGNSVELLSDYQESLDRLAADIDAAQHHVHLLFYIFAADEATQGIIEALLRAARRGVQCRVLVDALGSRRMLPALKQRLEPHGVPVQEVLRPRHFSRMGVRTDLRNHRKIAVIDGHIGYTGSQNLIRPTFKAGITFEELVVRLTGPAVLSLQFVFVGDWYLETEQVLDAPPIFPAPQTTGTVAAQSLPSGPTFAPQSIQRVVVPLIHNARHRVVVTTPYFIPDEPLQHALKVAALRGVDVKLIVSEIEDQFLVGQAQKSYYEELLEAGVQIHLFQRNFLHAKHLSIDDEVCLIGSSNMDIRSFVLNAEIGLLVYDRQVSARLAAVQQGVLQRSRQLELGAWRRRGYAPRLAQNLCRLLSPLL